MRHRIAMGGRRATAPSRRFVTDSASAGGERLAGNVGAAHSQAAAAQRLLAHLRIRTDHADKAATALHRRPEPTARLTGGEPR